MNSERPVIVKRYTDIEKPRTAVNACRIVTLLLSVALGATVIFLGVFFGKKAQVAKPPKTPQVSDGDYMAYLQQEKILTAWSHTLSSKINGEPAYKQLFTSDTQIALLNKFVQRHNFSETLIFTGSVEWSVMDWQRGAFPYQAQLESFLNKIQTPIGAMIYLNDDKTNMTGFDSLMYFGKAYNNFNSYMPAAKQLKRVLVQIEPQDEAGCIKYLEALLQLQMRIPKEKIWPTLNDYAYTAEISQETLRIFANLEITKLILGQNVTQISFLSAMKLVTQNVAILFDSPQIFPILQALNKLQAMEFAEPIVLYNVEKTKFVSGEQAINSLQELGTEAEGYKIIVAPKSYAQMYEMLYKNEPKDSQIGWLIDLYRT